MTLRLMPRIRPLSRAHMALASMAAAAALIGAAAPPAAAADSGPGLPGLPHVPDGCWDGEKTLPHGATMTIYYRNADLELVWIVEKVCDDGTWKTTSTKKV